MSIERRSRDRSRGVVFSMSEVVCCRMDHYEEYFEEVSDQEEEIGVVPPIPVVAVAPLNAEVAEIPDNLESPTPEPSPAASPTVASSPVASPPGLPVGGVTSFMGFYTYDDLTVFEKWTVDSRASRADPTSRIDEPDVSPNLKTFIRYVFGTQWRVKLIRESGEVLIEQLKAYLAGYNQLTSLNRRQLLRLFPAWTAQERREQLGALADAGGFWVVLGRRPFFYCLVRVSEVKILELHKKIQKLRYRISKKSRSNHQNRMQKSKSR